MAGMWQTGYGRETNSPGLACTAAAQLPHVSDVIPECPVRRNLRSEKTKVWDGKGSRDLEKQEDVWAHLDQLTSIDARAKRSKGWGWEAENKCSGCMCKVVIGGALRRCSGRGPKGSAGSRFGIASPPLH